ncbi:DUF5752 family protein [Candidatus Altiarchaeota archaeon]
MKAVILAGGLGTRFRPLTFTKPKPMLPLINKPVIQHIIDFLKGHGIDEVIVTTNYLRDYVKSSLGDGVDQGIKLRYPFEESPLGTAGSVKNIGGMLDETFIVIQGDNITNVNLTELIKFHRSSGGLATVGLIPVEDTSQFGIAELEDNGRVKRFIEKPDKEEGFSNLANIGIYVLEPEALQLVPDNAFFDFSRDLFPALVEKETIYGLEMDGFWVDVGQPEGYTKARDWLMTQITTNISDEALVSNDFEGILQVGENSQISKNTKILGPVVIGKNVHVEEDCILGPSTIIGDNVVIKKGTALQGSVVFEGNSFGLNSNLYDCIIAESSSFGQDTRIGFNVVVGSKCDIGQNVSFNNDSRIWPNQSIGDNSIINGTLRKFIQLHSVKKDPGWSLRTVSPEEAFYFNLAHNNKVHYTGFKAKNLNQFKHILERVDINSINYHLRQEQNDFREWMTTIICDYDLARRFEEIKNFNLDGDMLRTTLVEKTDKRVETLRKIADSKKAYI